MKLDRTWRAETLMNLDRAYLHPFRAHITLGISCAWNEREGQPVPRRVVEVTAEVKLILGPPCVHPGSSAQSAIASQNWPISGRIYSTDSAMGPGLTETKIRPLDTAKVDGVFTRDTSSQMSLLD